MSSFKLLPRPIIVLSKIFGIFPIDLETFNYSKLHLFNTVIQCVIPLIQMSAFILPQPTAYKDYSPYTFAVQMLYHCVISAANIGTKFVCTIAFKKYLKPIYSEMNACHTFLQTAYNFNANRSISLLLFFALLALSVVMLPVYAARIFSVTIKHCCSKRIGLRRVVFFLLMYWQNLTVCCAELQFIFIALNLYYQFQQINTVLRDMLASIDDIKYSHLKNVFSPREFGDSPPGGDTSAYDTSARVCNEKYNRETKRMMAEYYFYDISDAHRVLRKSQVGTHIYGATDFSAEVLDLREAHMHLSEALYLLNKLFSTQLFLSLCLCFCCTLLDVNYEVFGYFDKGVSRLKFGIVAWVLGFSLRFVTVVLVANYTCLKARYAGTLVASMANRFLDDDTKEELMLFSKHVLSCEFEFTACEFFALNMGLVTSAIATGTTYLVILLQFQP